MWGVNMLSGWISCICVERSVIFEELKLEVSNDNDQEINCLGVSFNTGDEKQIGTGEKIGKHFDQVRFGRGLRIYEERKIGWVQD